MALRTFIDRYALIIAMVLGALGYKWLTHLNGLTSPLIFLMLFFTFCKINPLDLRLRTWHWLVLAAQLTLTAILFWAFYALSPNGFSASSPSTSIAQSIILCVLMPTATAAPIIAGKLGGSIQNLTTFSLLSNFATAIIVPALFPIINPSADIAFLPAMWQILCRVTPLLLGPFIAAWILRLSFDTYYRGRGMSQRFQLKGIWASMPFYLWIVLLIVLMARITHTLVSQEYAWITILYCVLEP